MAPNLRLVAVSNETCDWRGCGNKAYREVDYFTNKRLRLKVAKRLGAMREDESRRYLQKLFLRRQTSWSFLCRKHFEQERDANRIIAWSTLPESGAAAV